MPKRHRINRCASAEDPPLAISPDGIRIHTFKELPVLPPPKRVVVATNHLEIDEWIVFWRPLDKHTLQWILQQFSNWRNTDLSEENGKQLLGILDALETHFHRRPENLRPT